MIKVLLILIIIIMIQDECVWGCSRARRTRLLHRNGISVPKRDWKRDFQTRLGFPASKRREVTAFLVITGTLLMVSIYVAIRNQRPFYLGRSFGMKTSMYDDKEGHISSYRHQQEGLMDSLSDLVFESLQKHY